MDELRQSLAHEQRGLCCYCMNRIQAHKEKMNVEHWHCQSKYPQEQLVYRNLLGVCKGGEGQPPNYQHCDRRKGDLDLQWNPANPAHRIEMRIRYELDGTIRSNDQAFDQQLKDVLNLNLPWFKNGRKGVLVGILYWWRTTHPSIKQIERELHRRTSSRGELQPYCQVAIWWLRTKLTRKANG